MTSPQHRLLSIAAATILVALTALTATAAQAAHPSSERQCVAAVEQSLKSQGVSAEAIAKTEYVTDIENQKTGRVREYQAWTPLQSCSGSLVTKLTTSCKVKETYASGNCSLQNVGTN